MQCPFYVSVNQKKKQLNSFTFFFFLIAKRKAALLHPLSMLLSSIPYFFRNNFEKHRRSGFPNTPIAF